MNLRKNNCSYNAIQRGKGIKRREALKRVINYRYSICTKEDLEHLTEAICYLNCNGTSLKGILTLGGFTEEEVKKYIKE